VKLDHTQWPKQQVEYNGILLLNFHKRKRRSTENDLFAFVNWIFPLKSSVDS
jgi:hypothetical protein